MNISIEKNDKTMELMMSLASSNKETCENAQIALAEYLTPFINAQYNQAPVLRNLFTEIKFNQDSKPTLPLDAFSDWEDSQHATIWSQSGDGGLPTNEVKIAGSEIRIVTKELNTAASFKKSYVRDGLMDVVPRTFERITQQLLNIENVESMNVISAAVIGAETNGRKHLMRSSVEGSLTPDDFNNLVTYAARLYTSWLNGTPADAPSGEITDLIMSPEMIGELRKMAYNPINTSPAYMEGAVKNGIPAPEEFRAKLFSSVGLPNFFGFNLMKYNEFGKNQKFNKVFGKLIGNTQIGGKAFDAATQEVILGINRNAKSLYNLVSTDSNGNGITFDVDDQFPKRAGKIGWYGKTENGKLIVDDRALSGIIV